jgi:predicted amidohydrolase YtcJ
MTDRAVDLGLITGFGDDCLRIGHLKFFADGGMGARTAWMTQKYLDAQYGMNLTPMENIESAVKKADSAGLSCMVHAVGDRAVQEVISMFERVEGRKESRCLVPHRIEHVQVILPQDLARLGLLGNVVVSCHPNNMSLDISMIDQCAGTHGQYAYNLKSIHDTGIPMMLGSDAPVADPSSLAGIYSAVTRKRMDKTPVPGWYREQRLGIEPAVRGYTSVPARVMGQGDRLGTLSAGKFADMVVLEQDPFDIEPEEIAGIKVGMTLSGGKIVYEG